MDRQIVYDGALPQTLDILGTNKNALLGLAYAMRGVLGTPTAVHDLACTPTTPTASLQVVVGVGAIYTLEACDASAYGDLGTDSHQIVKQGILADPVTLTCTPPGTGGYSQYYLVEAILNDVDSGALVLPYYNLANPAQPLSGPGNNGQPQYTTRQVVCTIALKAGTPAATGTETIPAPDGGYVGLWAVHVTNGQTQITAPNITLRPTAPFFPTLPFVPLGVQENYWTYAVDTGTQNAMAATVYPPVTSLVAGLGVFVKAAFANTAAATFNLNGLGNVAIHRANGAAVQSGDYSAGQILALFYDGSSWQILNFFGYSASSTNINNFVLSIPYAQDTGAVNAMVGVYNPAINALSAGNVVLIKAANTNTGPTTLQCNALSAVPIYEWGGNTPLQPRAILSGEVVALLYDGTMFQKLNARWPFYFFDEASSPPASDLPMAIGDHFAITFTNALSIPLKVAAVPGVYSIELVITASNSLRCDLTLRPNNTTYAGKFNAYALLFNTGSAGPSQVPSGNNATTSGNPDTGANPVTFWSSGGGAFDIPMFGQIAAGDTVDGVAPFMLNIICSTFTAAKNVRWNGAIVGGPTNGFEKWLDTTTAWTSLGTIVVYQPLSGNYNGNTPLGTPPVAASVTGTVIVRRLA
jgi:hypothetical protein